MDKYQFRNALSVLASLDRAMPLSAIQTLVWTALNEGSHQIDLENYLGSSNATASRAVAYWSEWRSFKDGERGPGFIESYPDPMDRRFRVLKFTSAGNAYFHKMLEGFNGAPTRK